MILGLFIAFFGNKFVRFTTFTVCTIAISLFLVWITFYVLSKARKPPTIAALYWVILGFGFLFALLFSIVISRSKMVSRVLVGAFTGFVFALQIIAGSKL